MKMYGQFALLQVLKHYQFIAFVDKLVLGFGEVILAVPEIHIIPHNNQLILFQLLFLHSVEHGLPLIFFALGSEKGEVHLAYSCLL